MRGNYPLPKHIRDEETFYPYVKLTTIILVTIAILAAMWFWGLAILSNLDAFWKIFNPPDEATTLPKNEKAPPPPYLYPMDPSTKEKNVTVKGYTVEGMLVKLFLNNKEVGSSRADKEGSFSFFNIELNEGENNLYAKTVVGNDLTSPASKTITVRYIKKAPTLEVSEPPDRAEFKQKEEMITIKGRTEPSSTVTVNGQKALVTSDGTFTYLFPLKEGENRITIESFDEAGNKTTVEKNVTFSRTF